MSEVEKMYENANIKQDRICEWVCKDSELCNVNCEHYESTQIYYPPFTAEKQLELENFLLEDSEDKTFTQFEMLKTIENKFLYVYRFLKNNSSLKRVDTIGKTRQECLAGLINSLWQDLTEQERTEIKRVLE